MKFILKYYLFFAVLIGKAQTEIPTIDIDCKEFDDATKMDFTTLPVSCTNSPMRIIFINSQAELNAFYSQYGLDLKVCSDISLVVDFNSYALLFAGIGVWGNQTAQIEFYSKNDSLALLTRIITPRNMDASINVELKIFVIERKYCQRPIVSRSCYLIQD